MKRKTSARRTTYKNAIQENFDVSAPYYESFEEKYHMYGMLTEKLTELMGNGDVKRVLDVGCGTGISTHALSNCFGEECTYYGLDISEKMLEIAKRKYAHRENFIFTHGDGEHLKEYYFETFDAIFYTASLFLFPNFKNSLKDAFSLLNERKKIAISFYSGITTIEGVDLVESHFTSLRYSSGAVTLDNLLDYLTKEGSKHFIADYHFPSTRECLTDFLSIPAQASALFPRQSFSTQLYLVKEFVDDLFRAEEEVFMKWTFIIASK